MTIQAPSPERILDIAIDFGLDLSDEDARSFAGLIAGSVPSYNRLDELAEPSLPVKYHTPGYRPAPDENPYNAWYWRCEIKGPIRDPSPKRVAIKDNVCVAACLHERLPGDRGLRARSRRHGGHPDPGCRRRDRGQGGLRGSVLLGREPHQQAGADQEPAPADALSGRPSCGSGAALAAGDCDMALGGDQGGSIRIPGAWCGVYGLKPTHGLGCPTPASCRSSSPSTIAAPWRTRSRTLRSCSRRLPVRTATIRARSMCRCKTIWPTSIRALPA